MRTSCLAIATLCLTIALGGCGDRGAGSEHPSSASTTTAAPIPQVSNDPHPATRDQQQAVGLAPTPAAKVRRANEDGSETVEDAAGDNGTHNVLLAAVASTVAATSATAAAATTSGPSMWQEGVNYTRLVPAQPTSVPAGQVEVLEFFWYGCPHCYAIDPLVESWKKTKPSYVSFARVPVMWSEGHRSTARLYYTLESMGKLDQLHGEVFKEIHVNNDPLITADQNDAAGAERLQTAFVKKFGISEDAFKKSYHSFSVETALQRADQLVQRYRIEGVPTFVVNGKFLVDVRSAGSPEKLLTLVDDLAGQEHKH